MRQVGVLAAAGRYALEHQLRRLADDHGRARRLAEVAATVRSGLVDPAEVQANIVVLDLAGTGLVAGPVVAAARAGGVALSTLGPRTVRLVTHLGIGDSDVEHAAAVLRKLLAR